MQRFFLLFSALASNACGSSSTRPSENIPTPTAGWVADIARNPEAFSSLMTSTGRDGWVAFHANDLQGAVLAFSGDSPDVARSRARAELTLGVMHDDLARLTWLATEAFFSRWEKRATLPAKSAAPVVVALSARCAGADYSSWAFRARTAAVGASFASSLDTDGGLWPPQTTVSDDPFVQRRVLHEKARQGEAAELLAASQIPLLVEPADGFERRFYDPCIHRTLADIWLESAAKSLTGDSKVAWPAAGKSWADPKAGLSASLFAPWLTPADLEEELFAAKKPGMLGATMPSLLPLGIAAEPLEYDDVGVAREDARRLTAALDRWKKELLADASPDGRAIILDLQPTERFRQEWLVTRGRLALVENRPRQGLVYLQLARNVAAHGIGPENAPAVFALLAEADLRNGHTREALDALQILNDSYPEVLGLKELVGDLAVLEGIDRRGDSKEN